MKKSFMPINTSRYSVRPRIPLYNSTEDYGTRQSNRLLRYYQSERKKSYRIHENMFDRLLEILII